MLDNNNLNEFKKKYMQNKNNQVLERILNKVQLVDLIQDKTTKLTHDFNINIKTHGITNQEASGRCWAFALLNILREKVISKCDLDNFELSGSFIAFYDKLERFNVLLESLISYQKNNQDLYDRYVSHLLENGLTDGGYFTEAKSLINKYGIVPKNVFPESFASSNTYEINLILSRLLRKFYLELENCSNEENLKNTYLEKAFNILTNVYGLPPETFDFEYTDKNGKYHLDKDLTPKSFYDKYIGINLNDYIEISSYKDTKFQYNNLYEEEESTRVSGTPNNITLNVSPKILKTLIIKQLKNNEPVYFYCSTTAKRIDGLWFDTLKRYGEIFNIDLELDNNSNLKSNGLTGCHAMIITGVNLIDNTPTKWKVENTWGNKVGKDGYYIATDDWMDKYIYRIVINKKYLSAKEKELLNKKPIFIKKWDAKY